MPSLPHTVFGSNDAVYRRSVDARKYELKPINELANFRLFKREWE